MVADEQTLSIEEIMNRKLQEAYKKMLGFEDPDLIKKHEEWETPRSPLIFKHNIGEATVTMVGVSHSKVLDSPTTTGTKEAFLNYIAATTTERRLIMVEGFHGSEPQALDTFEASVTHGGESWGITFLARKNDVDVVSPEVPRGKVIEMLKQEGIGADLIALFYTMRNLGSMVRNNELTNENLAKIIYGNATASGVNWLQEYDQTRVTTIIDNEEERQRAINKVLEVGIPRLNAILIREVGNTLFDDAGKLLLDPEIVHSYHSPGIDAPDTIFKRIAQIDNQARDEFLLAQIVNAVKEGKDPMVIFGGTHVLRLEPALEYLETI